MLVMHLYMRALSYELVVLFATFDLCIGYSVAYSDSAIVEFRKRKCKASDIISGVDLTNPQTESLSFTNHKCNTFILMSPKKQEEAITSSCLILATPLATVNAR